jgi:hypothetical protein
MVEQSGKTEASERRVTELERQLLSTKKENEALFTKIEELSK